MPSSARMAELASRTTAIPEAKARRFMAHVCHNCFPRPVGSRLPRQENEISPSLPNMHLPSARTNSDPALEVKEPGRVPRNGRRAGVETGASSRTFERVHDVFV